LAALLLLQSGDLLPQTREVFRVKEGILQFADKEVDQKRFRHGVLRAVTPAVREVAAAKLDALAIDLGPAAKSTTMPTAAQAVDRGRAAVTMGRGHRLILKQASRDALKLVALDKRFVVVGTTHPAIGGVLPGPLLTLHRLLQSALLEAVAPAGGV